MIIKPDSRSAPLRAHLDHEPRPLQFGTSGRRGLLLDLTQLEMYINALAELEYLQSLPVREGGIMRGDDFYFGADLRPSSTSIAMWSPPRGELAQAIESAIRAAGMRPIYCGALPTPALTAYALARGKGSIMVTGSHIPFDRNGYKTNTSAGELLKCHEQPINAHVLVVRKRLYAQAGDTSPFAANGQFKDGPRELPEVNPAATEDYLSRYLDFFGPEALRGLKVVVYQHSAVGRDLLPRILGQLGAEVFPAGRSEVFVPIDTENIDAPQLEVMQCLIEEVAALHGPVDALVSTDGDSDRPLVVGVDPVTGRAKFFGGDLLGMITAEYLNADAVVVPISCNDAIDRGAQRDIVEPKTRIGSPFVITGMQEAAARGRQAVCGWEANGGFLTATPITRNGRTLPALPTRDALLPIIAVLAAARASQQQLVRLFERLPRRFSRAALLKDFPREQSLALLRQLTPMNPGACEVVLGTYDDVDCCSAARETIAATATDVEALMAIRARLQSHFNRNGGFGEIRRLNYLDGLRIHFDNGDVAHIRPSGNADELRIYAVADTQERADAIAALGVAEPDGILRSLALGACGP
jgi:phosphomannomutase